MSSCPMCLLPVWFLIALVSLLSGPWTAAAAEFQEAVGCYISVGDNDWLSDSPPVQSSADIEAVFESLRTVFNVSRIYWRGAQSELIGQHYVVRPENFQLYDFWRWEDYLTREVGATRLAAQAAQARGMEFWGMTALFDHGGQARADVARGTGPSPVEERLRVEHPEWAPQDRYGVRRQDGPLEFAYPEVRQALVDRYTDLLVNSGYDGLMFYTYVEYFTMRFMDEFGYNDIIATEFQRRYGQDPRAETFDKHAWYRLRGEYVTEFLRELKQRLAQVGKRLGVAIDPQNTHYPAPWLVERDFINTGRIYLDWERWVREGLVDEIMVYCNGSLEAALNDVFAVTQGTDCAVSTISSAPFPPHHQHFSRAGLRRVMVGDNHDIESGYPDKGDLGSDDPLARMRALEQVAQGQLDVDLTSLMAVTRDPHVLVRRQALRALAAKGEVAAVPALEAALDDPEHSVRCTAAAALRQVHGPQSVAKLLDAVGRYESFQLHETIVSSLADMEEERTADLLAGADDPRPAVRRVAVYALGRGRFRPEAAPVLLRALRDPHDYVRYSAAYGLARCGPRPEVIDALLAALPDPHPTVRSRVALSLNSCTRSHSRWLSARQLKVRAALRDLFRQFGDGYEGPDADWGFRCVGEALAQMGPRGREVLEECLHQREDARLGDFAWRILYAPQSGNTYHRVPEEEAEQTYRRHPRLSPAPPALQPPPAEPEFMPYLEQNFDGFAPYVQGNVGDYLSETGEWRGFDDTAPAPLVQERVKRGDAGGAVRFTRGAAGSPHELHGLRADYRLSTEPTQVDFWVYLVGPEASFAATWKDSGTNPVPVSVYVAPGGAIAGWSGAEWIHTPVKLPLDSWQRLHFDVDPIRGTYTIRTGEDLETAVGEPVALPTDQTYNLLTISPQAPEGGVFYVDEVSVRVPNPAFPGNPPQT